MYALTYLSVITKLKLCSSKDLKELDYKCAMAGILTGYVALGNQSILRFKDGDSLVFGLDAITIITKDKPDTNAPSGRLRFIYL